jgi:hypothetical protein
MGWPEFIEQIESASSHTMGGRRFDPPRQAPQWIARLDCPTPTFKGGPCASN